MSNSFRRILFFGVALIGGLGLVAAMLVSLGQTPRPLPPSPTAVTPTPPAVATVDGLSIWRHEWEQAVALDHVMSGLVGQPPPAPEETLEQLINQHLVLRQATAAGIPETDPAQAEAWLADLIAAQNLTQAALDQALQRSQLTRADLVQEVIPRLLRVEQALNTLSPDGDAQAWVAALRDQAQIEIKESLYPLSSSLPPTPEPPPIQTTLPAGPGVGELAPNFRLEATDGTAVTLSDLRGRPVLLSFWATWCTMCHDELRLLQAITHSSATDMVVLTIDVRESPAKVQAVADELGLSSSLLDQTGQVNTDYQVRGLPTSFLIDRKGRIVARHVGPLDQETLDRYLALLQPAGEP